MKIYHFEHAFEVDGPLTAFHSRCLNPKKKKQKLNRQLDEMLEIKVITTSIIPWSSPVHLVKKKNDSFCLVNDLSLNCQLRPMNYSLFCI